MAAIKAAFVASEADDKAAPPGSADPTDTDAAGVADPTTDKTLATE